MTALTDNLQNREKLASLLEENSEGLLTCVHCGLCLPACPTYRVLGNENDSPRGRVYLMRGLVEGKLQVGDSFISHIDLCLGCRGCESVCPSSVPYGHLLEAARVEVTKAKAARRSVSSLLLGFVLNQVFTRPRLLAVLMRLSRWFRDSGPARLAFDEHIFSGRARFALALLLSSRSPLKGSSDDDSRKPATAKGGEPRVAVLRGCVMEGLFREANRATERVLMRNGSEVIEAEGQLCCGALHSHAGHIETARELARKNIRAFLESGCDFVIVNSAGCGAAMKEYDKLLSDDPDFAERARLFSSKVKDISEFLIEQGINAPDGRVERKVAYDAPCHLIHAQRIAQAPVKVLESVPGIRLVPLRGSESCCGGAGIYNLQHPELSAEILSDKLDSIQSSGADTVATANPGCIMQIGAGLKMRGIAVDVIHPIELLDNAYKDS
ncbi:MAG TPA: heterodisulfide reductase-related iron-sulfur binding cluster [Blastocatellia bacterium]|nr:heterodisulfide reductase-related iron-sulfur binding cluster [Blastocatellia bacterium]